jgi:colicin import membrane protein
MTQEIAVIDNTAIAQAFATPSGIDVLIQRIKSEASAEVPDLTTKKGRDRIASLAYKVSKTKTLVDDFGKELVAEEKKRLALIDADRKKWRDECDKLRDEIRKPLTDWEQAESDRIQRLKDAIQQLRELSALAMGTDSVAISGLIAQAESVTLGDHWQEFAAEAGKTKDETLSILRLDLLCRQQYESEQAELARLRAEAARREQEDADRRAAEAKAEAERLAAEREAQRIREAEERARREAEEAAAKARANAEAAALIEREAAARARIASEQAEARAKAEAEAAKLREQDAERRRVESEERAKREAQEAAERAERDRVAAVEAERQRAERQLIAEKEAAANAQAEREANKEHMRRINREALAGVVAAGISEEQGKALIKAIASGAVLHVSIAY